MNTLLCITSLFLSAGALGAPWEAELEDGRQIQVDPNTNRAVIESDVSTGTPLWDGVHRLKDGTVITVRSGLMVPNEDVMELRSDEIPEVDLPAGGVACDDLMLKSCGLNDACGAAEPCNLAKQLRSLRGEQTPTESGQRDWAELRCRQGLADPQMFPACASAQAVISAPCQKLVALVCGETQRCVESEACLLAQQLLALEEKANAAQNPEHVQDTQRQCQQTLGQHAFFPPCR